MSDLWRRFRRNPGAIGGGLFIVALGLIACGADYLAPTAPLNISSQILSPPSRTHPLGTDELGHDTLSGIIYGARVSLVVGMAAAATATLVGILVGATSGYYGGILDATLMRVSEFFQVIPSYILAVLVVALWGPGLFRIVLIIAALAWPQVARLTRGSVLRIKVLGFVDAARCIGMTDLRILSKEILPNVLGPVIPAGMLIVGQAILLEAALGFLGLSSPDVVSWGTILNAGQRELFNAWWLSVFPGSAIVCTVVAFNLLADGLIAALNPGGAS